MLWLLLLAECGKNTIIPPSLSSVAENSELITNILKGIPSTTLIFFLSSALP